MRLLPRDATDEDILAICRQWIELVAADRLTEAIDLLVVPADYDDSQRWTPESLRTYIENYGSWHPRVDGSKWRITPLLVAELPAGPWNPLEAELYRYDADHRAGSVEMAVPLNGEWSDLTAQFEFGPVPGGTAVSLYDLHVM